MDGCLICGEKHYGACNPRHPEHHPLTADEWDERELRGQPRELIKRRAEREDERMAAAEWALGTGYPLSQADELESQSRPLTPQEIIRRIATREGAVSPRDTIQSAAGRWLTVLEVEPPREPPENQKEIAVYGTRGAADERWQDAICRGATPQEIHNAQQAEREAHQLPARDSEKEPTRYTHPDVNESQSPAPAPGRWQTFKERAGAWFSRGEEAASQQERAAAPQSDQPRRYDLETPGPTEAAGGSFQQFHSKSEAVRAARLLPPSQDYYLDRVHDANGPTDSYVMTTFPAPATIARDPSVEKKIAALEDPAERAKARKLLEVIRSEVADQERPRERERERSQDLELER